MYDNIIFDADGTVINSFEGIKSSVSYAIKKLGKRQISDEILKTFIGPSLMDSFTNKLNYTIEEATKAIEYYREDYIVEGAYKCSFYSGMGELLDKLKSDGKTLTIATSKPQRFIDIILKDKGYYDHFTRIIGASDKDDHSDKAATVAKAIVGKRPIMVGDRHFDITAAKANGIDSIGVLYGFSEVGEFEKYAPTFVARDTKEIYKIITKN